MAANVSLFIILHATVPEERVSQKAGPGGIYLVRCQTFTCKTHCKSMFSNSLFQTLLSCSCLAPLTPCPRVSSPVRSQSRPLSLSHAGGAGRTGRIASLLGCCWISSSLRHGWQALASAGPTFWACAKQRWRLSSAAYLTEYCTEHHVPSARPVQNSSRGRRHRRRVVSAAGDHPGGEVTYSMPARTDAHQPCSSNHRPSRR